MTHVLALAVAFALLTTAAAIACGGNGGDPERVLQLSSGSFTEDQFRSLIQELIADQEPYEILCAALDGLTNDQAFRAYEHVTSLANPTAGGFVVADEKRAVQITREECEAVYG